MRLFIAAPIPGDELAKIVEIQNELKQGLRTAIRWINPGSIHLTLKFLGETPTNKIQDICCLMENVCNHMPIFSLVCGGVGAFPSIKFPKVIWLGLEAPPELFKLQTELEQKLTRLEFKEENRTFSPHLTLGRVQTHLSTEGSFFFSQKIVEYSNKKIAVVPVKTLELIKSDLQPSGPVYTVQGIISLKAE
jgi:2'-5' RNA ligase